MTVEIYDTRFSGGGETNEWKIRKLRMVGNDSKVCEQYFIHSPPSIRADNLEIILIILFCPVFSEI